MREKKMQSNSAVLEGITLGMTKEAIPTAWGQKLWGAIGKTKHGPQVQEGLEELMAHWTKNPSMVTPTSFFTEPAYAIAYPYAVSAAKATAQKAKQAVEAGGGLKNITARQVQRVGEGMKQQPMMSKMFSETVKRRLRP